MVKIAVDAMGGDFAPENIIKGIAEASKEFDAYFILVGDSAKLTPLIEKHNLPEDRFEIFHTEQFVEMDEAPRDALETKPEASIAVVSRLIAEDKADVLLSAGNTGAVVLAAKKYVPMIEGIERGALATVIPTAAFENTNPGFTFILDVGATVHCGVKHLVHFAIIGHYYSKDVLGIEKPRVALLNIGHEPTKGGTTLVKTYQMLSELPMLNFIGNIEGKDIPQGAADVIVCEGMMGNLSIKLIEGAAETFRGLLKFAYREKLRYKIGLAFLRSGIKHVKKKTDYSEYGGAPILGFRKPCIKAHGRSTPKAIRNAVRVAISAVEGNLSEKIHDAVIDFNRSHPIDLDE